MHGWIALILATIASAFLSNDAFPDSLLNLLDHPILRALSKATALCKNTFRAADCQHHGKQSAGREKGRAVYKTVVSNIFHVVPYIIAVSFRARQYWHRRVDKLQPDLLPLYISPSSWCPEY
jgi:hypothetical protein